MVGVDGGMDFYAFGAEKFQARRLGAEVGDGFFAVLIAGNIIIEVGFHVFDGEGRFHCCLY